MTKNVAGYDLSKLFVGSGGAYFAALELQLRLVPIPERSVWLASESTRLSEAYSTWLELRDRLSDARAVDLLVDAGSARVEVLAAGPKALVDELSRRSGLRRVEDLAIEPDEEDEARAAWSTLTRFSRDLVDSTAEAKKLARGRVRPSRAFDLLAAFGDDVRGRLHAQGAFVLGASAIERSRVPEGSVLGALRGFATIADANKTKFVTRLKACFGGGFARERAAFDVALTGSKP